MNIEKAYTAIGEQIRKMLKDGRDARPVSLDVHKDGAGHHVIVEFSDSNLIGLNFEDTEPYTPERREALEASFAVVCAVTLAMKEAA
ncbi:MAG: hypothetical protein A2052_03735 [Deltaproteobacteria bacterium GWA2_54_12]|nr:MAG: hypothetical protein A2052_03735 [Deltaproteobacteria bacterium GWA2_54_12]